MQLPVEIIREIFGLVDDWRDIARTAGTCCKWRGVALGNVWNVKFAAMTAPFALQVLSVYSFSHIVADTNILVYSPYIKKLGTILANIFKVSPHPCILETSSDQLINAVSQQTGINVTLVYTLISMYEHSWLPSYGYYKAYTAELDKVNDGSTVGAEREFIESFDITKRSKDIYLGEPEQYNNFIEVDMFKHVIIKFGQCGETDLSYFAEDMCGNTLTIMDNHTWDGYLVSKKELILCGVSLNDYEEVTIDTLILYDVLIHSRLESVRVSTVIIAGKMNYTLDYLERAFPGAEIIFDSGRLPKYVRDVLAK